MQITSNTNFKIIIGILVIILLIGGVLFFSNEREQSGASKDSNVVVENLEGDYVCLPHRGIAPGEEQTQECASGFRTGQGVYYALGASDSVLHRLFPGDRVIVSGRLTDVTEKDAELYRYQADKLLTVGSAIKPVTYDSDGILYSSELASKEINIDVPKLGTREEGRVDITGQVQESWLSKGQWGPKGTMRLIVEDGDGKIHLETATVLTGSVDGKGFVSFKSTITLNQPVLFNTGYIVIYQSNFSQRREYAKVPISFN